MTETTQIGTLLAERSAAIAAGDAAGAVATTADGAVTYDLVPPLRYVHDREAAIANLDAWFSTWAGPIESDLIDPTIIVSGDLAVAYGFSHLRGTSTSAEPHESWFRTTVVLERQPDGWRIIHEHLSYPMRMDGTELAATDLKPE